MTFTPRPGDFALSRSDGFVGAAIRVGTRSRYNHLRLVTSDRGDVLESLGQGATPGKIRPGDVVVSVPLTDAQRAAVPAVATSLVGVQYSYVGVALLGLAQVGIHLPGPLADRLRDPADLFCSQLWDEAVLRVGFHAFADGRLPHNVSPGDLHDLAFRSGWPARVFDPYDVEEFYRG